MPGHNERVLCSKDHPPSRAAACPTAPTASSGSTPAKTCRWRQRHAACAGLRKVAAVCLNENWSAQRTLQWPPIEPPRLNSKHRTRPGACPFRRGGLGRESADSHLARGFGAVAGQGGRDPSVTSGQLPVISPRSPATDSPAHRRTGHRLTDWFFPRWVQGAARLRWRVEDRLFIGCGALPLRPLREKGAQPA